MEPKSVQEEQELTVRGDSIENVYRQYRHGKYLVNLRYQRKLIWTVEEKQGFIDSVSRGFPVPIILLAGSANREPSNLEIIDGMQRLNAIFFYRKRLRIIGRAFRPKYNGCNQRAA